MPELPEVHTTVELLKKSTTGLKIKDVWSDYDSEYYSGKKNIKDREYFKEFKRAVINKEILNVTRKGKNVLIHLSDDLTILTHMKMTGHFLYGKYNKTTNKEEKRTFGSWAAEEAGPLSEDPFNRFIHLVFTLSNGKHLTLSDARKFATVFAFQNSSPPKAITDLGPDALDRSFTFSSFLNRLPHASQKNVKQVLLDQKIVSGIGNIYSDELLWRAGVHPESTVSSLNRQSLYGIYDSMKIILREGINLKGDSVSDYRLPNGEKGSYHYNHKVYRRKGEECSYQRCKGEIKRTVIGGRGSYYCDQHQILYSPEQSPRINLPDKK
ncbi:MAG: bifunctional DNA-formamidopyrimidine glycosylase/DNA-(apurinic or apyrimidinic site) lyase [Patescibacteria group bacterium]